MADNYYQDPLGAPDYSAQGMPSLLSLSNLESLGRGSVAGLFDLPYVIEGMLRGDVDPRMPQRKRVVPSSEQVLATTPRMTQPTPQAGLLETAGAFMSPAPVAAVKPVAKAVGKAVKATEGLPVGMSIKDVSYRGSHLAPNAKNYGATLDDLTKILPEDVYSQQGKQLYGFGDRMIDSEWRIAALKTRGKPNAEVEIFRAVPKGVKDINSGDWVSTSKTYAKQHGETTLGGDYEIISKKVPAKTLSTEGYPYEYGYNINFEYPQQAALDLAQQRAALPVSEGGLGLPANNTPMDRARAMGFDVNTPLYHATDVDFQSIRPSLQGKLGAGVYVSPSSKYAEKYTSLNAAGNARVLPLVARGKLADDDLVMNIAESIRQEMATQNPNFSVSEWKKRTTQALADAGYDGRNMSGLESVITNPDNLRSRFAAFDPFRKDVATATAMGVALPDLLAAEPTPQPQSSGLLYPFP